MYMGATAATCCKEAKFDLEIIMF
uniref:Uncharacterized protein n=1 Tax=Rhizophora mucronata TaxID=61149 RepID=A0A2P2PAW0_RHIMU